jgi:hypothetical protein
MNTGDVGFPTTRYDTLLFAASKNGLANRLRALVGYDAVSRLRNWQFRLCWVPHLACEAHFAELFEPSTLTLITPDEARLLRAAPSTLTCDAPDWFHVIWQQYVPDVSWMTFLRTVYDSLQGLTPAKAIRDAVAAFYHAHLLADAVGVHIRHTDNVAVFSHRASDNNFDVRRLSTFDGFLRNIRTHIDRRPVFLATDNASVERRCKTEFGDRIITYPKHYTLDWEKAHEPHQHWRRMPHRTSSVTEALIEMLLLRNCTLIVGTYFSSFSKFAAVWGQTEYLEIADRSAIAHPLMESTIADLRTIGRGDRRREKYDGFCAINPLTSRTIESE